MYDGLWATGTTGTSEFKVLLAAIEVSDGCEVEICSLDVVGGRIMLGFF